MTTKSNLPISCNIKPPVHVRLGDHKVDFHSGCSVIDISFNTFYVEIGEITFQNHHTAWLSVQVQIKENNSEENDELKGKKRDFKWRTAVTRFQMMPQPHADTGAEGFFTITRKNMNFDLVNVSGLRFVLRQPSPIWKEFKIDDIAVYKQQMQLEPEVPLPTWLNDDQEDTTIKKINGVSSLGSVCSSLQQMWAMTDTVHSNQATATLGRYDIEGSYEINLLSYT